MSLLAAIASNVIRSSQKSYVPHPSPPAFSDAQTLVTGSVGNSISLAETNGKFDLLLGSDFAFLQLNGLTGSYRVKSDDTTSPATWRTLGSVGPAAAFSSAAATPTIELYNVKLFGTDAGIKFTTSVIPKSQRYQEIIITDIGFAALQINEDVAGEDYGDFTSEFIMVNGTGGELDYLGNTGNDLSTYKGLTYSKNCYGINLSREGIQRNGHTLCQISNYTIIGDGVNLGEGIGQNNWAQIQNAFDGYLKNTIAFNFLSPGMFAVNQFTIENNFIEFLDNTRNVFFQNMVANGYDMYANPGGTVTVKDCVWKNPTFGASSLFTIQDSTCQYVFTGDIYVPASATDKFDDQRTDKLTYPIIDNATWHFTNSPPTPVLGNPPEAEYIGIEQVVIDDYWHGRGCGHRS